MEPYVRPGVSTKFEPVECNFFDNFQKAVTGTYANDYYQDRSLTAIGEKEAKYNRDLADTGTQDDDAEIVKHRLENIKHRRRENEIRDDKSAIF